MKNQITQAIGYAYGISHWPTLCVAYNLVPIPDLRSADGTLPICGYT